MKKVKRKSLVENPKRRNLKNYQDGNQEHSEAGPEDSRQIVHIYSSNFLIPKKIGTAAEAEKQNTCSE